MMKALSLWQPWASLVVLGLKQYETRSWSTNYRGTLVIHAAKTWNKVCADALDDFGRRFNVKANQIAPLGRALGTVELVEIYTTDELFGTGVILRKSKEYAFGDYSPGRYAWKLANPILFAEPIPCAGHQRLWEVGDYADGS